ncbi:hypothetical protein DFS34DRAFT_592940 [Phlyctochytrium arcticum]|nr:hypothetical protein DFS34DRAFT_592940 [Phlyctochytrium arcticum]
MSMFVTRSSCKSGPTRGLLPGRLGINIANIPQRPSEAPTPHARHANPYLVPATLRLGRNIAIKANAPSKDNPTSQTVSLYPGFQHAAAAYAARLIMTSIPILKDTEAASFAEVVSVSRVPSVTNNEQAGLDLHVLFPRRISHGTAG